MTRAVASWRAGSRSRWRPLALLLVLPALVLAPAARRAAISARRRTTSASTTTPMSCRRPRRRRRQQIIAGIQQRTGAEVVVYTQYKPGSDDDSTDQDAIALINQWGVGRKGFDDGLAILWNTNRDAVPARRQRQRPGPALRRRPAIRRRTCPTRTPGNLRQRHAAATCQQCDDDGALARGARQDRCQRHAGARRDAATRRASWTRPSG